MGSGGVGGGAAHGEEAVGAPSRTLGLGVAAPRGGDGWRRGRSSGRREEYYPFPGRVYYVLLNRFLFFVIMFFVFVIMVLFKDFFGILRRR